MLINKIKLSNTDIIDGFLTIPLSSNFSPETNQYENVEKNFNLSTTDIITPIVDYEKVKLIPSGQTGMANSLNFKLHFFTGTSWDSDSTPLTGDSVGFTIDDIKNNKKKLSKSFIRLSFYDSKDLKTQNLLYFSTIFLDSDTIYSKYISGTSVNNLKAEFLCEDPKLSRKIKSFEGFNLYLFKDDVYKNKSKTIYMRVDFNNAGNGRSTLFMRENPSPVTGCTMQQLYDNLFFEVVCGYNQTLKKYMYSFPGYDITTHSDTIDKYIKNTINIDLYQARVI